MTTQEFMQKELEKHKKSRNHQIKRGANPGDIKNIEEKISHYEKVCDLLTKEEENE